MTPEQKARIFDKITKHSLDMVCTLDRQGRFTYVSDACHSILGYNSEEMIGCYFRDSLSPEDRDVYEREFRPVAEKISKINFETALLHRDGHRAHLLWSGTWSEEDEAFIVVAREVTKERLVRQKLQEKEEFHLALGEYVSDMTTLLDTEGKVLYSTGSALEAFGYEPGSLVDHNAFSLIHPDDLNIAESSFSKLLSGSKHVQVPEFRFKTAEGKWRWIEANLSNQLNNPSVRALVVTSRDTTERMESRLRLEQSEQRFRSLFENHADAVVYQNRQGHIIDANPAMMTLLGVQKQQVINRPFSHFMPEEVASVFERTLQEAFKVRVVRFDIAIPFEGAGVKFFDIIKIPVKVEGETVGVHSILRDMTEIYNSRGVIEKQADKLHSIFESITDAFFALDMEWQFTYVNSVFASHEGYKKEELLGRSIWELFPALVASLFYRKCRETAATGVSSHFEESYAHTGVTYEFSIYPAEDGGVSVYFIDVTEQKKAQRELEKLSLVANKTTNGVVFMSPDRRIEWVNQGFTELTGYTFEEAVGKRPLELLQHDETDLVVLATAREQTSNGETVAYEILNRRKNGEDIWLSIEMSPVQDENGDLLRYVTIQTDITALKKSEIELQKLSLVASKTNNSVIIADKDWRTEWVNEGFTKLMGYTMQEAVGKRPSELLHNRKTDRTAYEALEGKLLQGEPISLETINIKKNGEEVWVHIDITAIFDKTGELIRFIEVHTDISALKEKEQELTRLTEDLYTQNRDLQQFTYIVSHNLRAPVANILGLSSLLLTADKESAMYGKALHNLKESTLKLDIVVRDVNTILSIRDSKHALEQEKVNVAEVCRQACQNLQEQLIQYGGLVTIDIQESLCVRANKAYLHSVFYNLLSNAIKYRSKEQTLRVQVSYHRSPEGAAIVTFSDNGSGFDMQKAGDSVFKLYKRFHTSKDGRGIGLYLVKAHVEAMGWRIEVNSQVNAGTTFSIYLN